MSQITSQTPIPLGTGIWTKLLRIQSNVKGFINTNDSGTRKPGTKEPEYQFTPSWKITTAVREQMDKEHVLMTMDIKDEKHEFIDTPIYKTVNNKLYNYNKKEILSTVTIEYQWIDADSGETAGPFQMIASAVNENNKSTTTAISLAEKYIFLKFFHIATRDKDDEVDAMDTRSIQGLPETEQAAKAPILQQMNTPVQPAAPYTQGQANWNTGTANQQPKKQEQFIQNQQTDVRKQIYDALEQMNPAFKQSVMNLMNYEQGTQSHNIQLVKELNSLNQAGLPTADPEFQRSLVNISQAYRENRLPVM